MCLEKEQVAAHALWAALPPGTAAFVPKPAAGHPHGYLTQAQTSTVSCHSQSQHQVSHSPVMFACLKLFQPLPSSELIYLCNSTTTVQWPGHALWTTDPEQKLWDNTVKSRLHEKCLGLQLNNIKQFEFPSQHLLIVCITPTPSSHMCHPIVFSLRSAISKESP